MSAFHTGIHQRYVMKVDPAAASLRGQHTEQNTITEYMIFEFTAYTATTFVMLQDGAKLNPFCISGTLPAEPIMHLKRENSEFDLQLVQVYPRMSTGGGTVVAEGDAHAEGQ
jgi:hypothetical protein